MRAHAGLVPVVGLLGIGLLAATACAGGDDARSTGTSTGTRTLAVFAAASLTDAFAEMADAFGEANSGVTVELNLAASSTLREQILSGAPADVFASADISNMTQLLDAGLAEGAGDFATNRLEIAVPAGNPAGIAGLADFANGDLLVGLCAEEVPCGQFGREALAKAGVTPSIDTNEPDVRSLLTKIEAGELDAGIVYRTDVLAASDSVDGIDIAPDHNVTATYPIASLTVSAHPEVADAFVAFVLADEGQRLLRAYGFGEP